MRLKTINFSLNLMSPEVVTLTTTPQILTNDRESVQLTFTIKDVLDLTGATAILYLFMEDGSLYQIMASDVLRNNNVFSYVMTGNQHLHNGWVKTQLVVTHGGKDYATQLFEFEIVAGLNTQVVTEVMISDWLAVTEEAQAFLDSIYTREQQLAQLAADAEASAVAAAQSEAVTTQTMQDYLAMIGVDIATLDANGKLSPSQIPAISVTSTFTVTSVAGITALTAEEGDVAVVIPVDTVTDTYILAGADPTVLSNWKKLGVGYVAEAGHAVSADTASNALLINNKRIVAMTQAEYDIAVKDPDTIYIITP